MWCVYVSNQGLITLPLTCLLPEGEWKGKNPAIMANRTTPSDHTSTGGPSYCFRATISGAA